VAATLVDVTGTAELVEGLGSGELSNVGRPGMIAIGTREREARAKHI
jgi:hypothetical protein